MFSVMRLKIGNTVSICVHKHVSSAAYRALKRRLPALCVFPILLRGNPEVFFKKRAVVALAAEMIEACNIRKFVVRMFDEVLRFPDALPRDKIRHGEAGFLLEKAAQIIRIHKGMLCSHRLSFNVSNILWGTSQEV